MSDQRFDILNLGQDEDWEGLGLIRGGLPVKDSTSGE